MKTTHRDGSGVGNWRTIAGHAALAGALAASLAACAFGEASGGGGGGSGDKTLIIGTPLEPASLHILRDGDDANELVNWSINQPLVDRGPDGIEPILASELPVVDESDQTRWHVKLREGIEFTNGEPFNAEAVKANIDLVTDPDFGATINGVETLKGAEVVDEYSVDIITTKPDPWLLYRISTIRFIPPKASADADEYSKHPIGTGPYVFDSWSPGQQLILKKNEDYWGGDDAQLDEVEFRFIPDESARLSALEAGEVDMVTGLTPDQADRVPQVLKSSTYVNGTTLRFNMDATGPYSDVNFRKALMISIDRQSIVDNLFGGDALVEPCQMLPEGEIGFNDSVEAAPYDPDAAKKLLEDVDIPDGFKVQLNITTGVYPKDNEIAQAIAANWEAIGLKADINYLSLDAWLDDLLAGGDKTKADSPAPITYVPLDYYGLFASRISNRLYDRGNPLSSLGKAEPQLDALFETGESSFDEAEADAAYQEIFKTACDEVINIPLVDYPDMWGASDAVTYETGPSMLSRIHLDEITLS